MRPINQIYLDNAATTKPDKRVLEAMLPWMDAANPSSLHHQGGEARNAVEKARATIAHSLGADPKEIIFTSGGTEANNLALKGFALANKEKGTHLITTRIEHKSIMKTCAYLETLGFTVTYLDVDEHGFVDPAVLEQAITPQTILVSIIHANNEVGTVQDLETLGKICANHGVAFHSDACQSYTKEPIDVKKQHLSLLTINSHKIHGPKGVGALYVKRLTKMVPLFHGGEHEFGMRAGTENVAGIVGFATAATIDADVARVARLRDTLIDGLLTIEGSRLNGPRDARLSNNVNVSFAGVEGEAIIGRLDGEGIACSTGSACSEASLEPSYVLKAIGLSDEEANGSVRMTLSRYTTAQEVERVLAVLPRIIDELRAISPVGR